MSLTKELSSRVIVIIETVAIVVLAVIVVIYAQVLIQQYTSQSQVVSDEESMDETEAETTYSIEERMRVLEELQAVRSDEIAPEDRQAALDALVSEQVVVEPTPEEMQERMRVLESLQ